MIPKAATLSLDLSVKPRDAVFPMRVILGDTRYDFQAKIVRRRRLRGVDRFDLEVVGSISMTSTRKPKRKGRK